MPSVCKRMSDFSDYFNDRSPRGPGLSLLEFRETNASHADGPHEHFVGAHGTLFGLDNLLAYREQRHGSTRIAADRQTATGGDRDVVAARELFLQMSCVSLIETLFQDRNMPATLDVAANRAVIQTLPFQTTTQNRLASQAHPSGNFNTRWSKSPSSAIHFMLAAFQLTCFVVVSRMMWLGKFALNNCPGANTVTSPARIAQL